MNFKLLSIPMNSDFYFYCHPRDPSNPENNSLPMRLKFRRGGLIKQIIWIFYPYINYLSEFQRSFSRHPVYYTDTIYKTNYLHLQRSSKMAIYKIVLETSLPGDYLSKLTTQILLRVSAAFGRDRLFSEKSLRKHHFRKEKENVRWEKTWSHLSPFFLFKNGPKMK